MRTQVIDLSLGEHGGQAPALALPHYKGRPRGLMRYGPTAVLGQKYYRSASCLLPPALSRGPRPAV